ncbi:MAG TPA: hypothetical protein QGF58_21895 [Myxococcota bacterium]|nr:hypothetical protein [Myxococcota bacterium]
MSEIETAKRIEAILQDHANDPAVRRLHIRVSELGENQTDEWLQFRELQKACRESEALSEAFEAGFGKLQDLHIGDPKAGPLVQGFNTLIETSWEKA